MEKQIQKSSEQKHTERQEALRTFKETITVADGDSSTTITIEQKAVTWWQRTKRKIGIQ